MAEAFIMGGGGGNATVQRITLSEVTSLTIPLTNPKRKNCMVFGVYSYYRNTYTTYPVNMVQYSYRYRCCLYGNTFDRKLASSYDDYPGSGDWSKTEYEEALTTGFFTRNANSLTLTIGYIAATDTEWDSSTDTTTIKEKRGNSIDIYVVDYD